MECVFYRRFSLYKVLRPWFSIWTKIVLDVKEKKVKRMEKNFQRSQCLRVLDMKEI
jgi:hypothetical protein